MIVSRIALLLALVAMGCLIPCGDRTAGPVEHARAETAASAEIAAQLSGAPTRPFPANGDGGLSAPRVPVSSASELRLAAYQPSRATATMLDDQPAPTQLISPEIKARTELIPGRWKARSRLLSDVFGEQGNNPEPWISELQPPPLDGRLEAPPASSEEAHSRRGRSIRR